MSGISDSTYRSATGRSPRCRRSVPTPRRYELGLPSLPALAASRAGIELILKAGVPAISGHVEALVEQCLSGLADYGQSLMTPRDPRSRAGVIVFPHGSASKLFDDCRAEAVDIGALGTHGGLVRVDVHGFNSDDDVDRFLSCYRRFTR